MASIKTPVFVLALVLAGIVTVSCTNRNGAGGTSDDSSAAAYELGSEKNLAPPMDSVKTTVPDSTSADTAKPGASKSGE